MGLDLQKIQQHARAALRPAQRSEQRNLLKTKHVRVDTYFRAKASDPLSRHYSLGITAEGQGAFKVGPRRFELGRRIKFEINGEPHYLAFEGSIGGKVKGKLTAEVSAHANVLAGTALVVKLKGAPKSELDLSGKLLLRSNQCGTIADGGLELKVKLDAHGEGTLILVPGEDAKLKVFKRVGVTADSKVAINTHLLDGNIPGSTGACELYQLSPVDELVPWRVLPYLSPVGAGYMLGRAHGPKAIKAGKKLWGQASGAATEAASKIKNLFP